MALQDIDTLQFTTSLLKRRSRHGKVVLCHLLADKRTAMLVLLLNQLMAILPRTINTNINTRISLQLRLPARIQATTSSMLNRRMGIVQGEHQVCIKPRSSLSSLSSSITRRRLSHIINNPPDLNSMRRGRDLRSS